ncbi:MAG: hypothetical protein LBK61_08070 [Spirochaetaceae bacterium]|jgi:hypothetical protein|nr:hypothetical protein [Spirochaetaceae bacterium]
MIVYLDADCVLNALVEAQIIKPENWKRTNAKKYIVRFYHALTNGTLCFEIYTDGGSHRMSALYIKNLERLYGIDSSAIATQCAI